MIYCAYCKGRVFGADRKCPSCGSTTFIDDETRASYEAQPVYTQPVYTEPVYTGMAAGLAPDGAAEVVITRELTSGRNRWIALLLCLFGGLFGVHRFYVGKIFSGVIYLITGGLFGIGATVDFFCILFGNFRDKYGLRLNN